MHLLEDPVRISSIRRHVLSIEHRYQSEQRIVEIVDWSDFHQYGHKALLFFAHEARDWDQIAKPLGTYDVLIARATVVGPQVGTIHLV